MIYDPYYYLITSQLKFFNKKLRELNLEMDRISEILIKIPLSDIQLDTKIWVFKMNVIAEKIMFYEDQIHKIWHKNSN